MVKIELFDYLTMCKHMTDVKLICGCYTDYADDIVLLANAPAQAESLLNSLERAAAGIGLHVNADKTEYMSFYQKGDIYTLNGSSLKLVKKSSPTWEAVSHQHATSKGMDH